MELLIGFLIALLVGGVTYFDAKKRNMRAWAWAIGTIASMFPVLVIYFIVRSPKV